jgi:hypothetical protein
MPSIEDFIYPKENKGQIGVGIPLQGKQDNTVTFYGKEGFYFEDKHGKLDILMALRSLRVITWVNMLLTGINIFITFKLITSP